MSIFRSTVGIVVLPFEYWRMGIDVGEAGKNPTCSAPTVTPYSRMAGSAPSGVRVAPSRDLCRSLSANVSTNRVTTSARAAGPQPCCRLFTGLGLGLAIHQRIKRGAENPAAARGRLKDRGIILIVISGIAFLGSAFAGGGGGFEGWLFAGVLNPVVWVCLPLGIYWVHAAMNLEGGITAHNKASGRTNSLDIYRRAAEQQPPNADAYVDWGNALLENQRYDEAIAAYQVAQQVDPSCYGEN